MADLAPFVLVVSDQHLVVQTVRLHIHRQHVIGKMKQLGNVARRKESEAIRQLHGFALVTPFRGTLAPVGNTEKGGAA